MSALSVMRHAATRLELTADTLQGEQAREYRHSAQRLRTARNALERLVTAASNLARSVGLYDIHRDDPDLARLAACLRELGEVQ